MENMCNNRTLIIALIELLSVLQVVN